DGELAGRHAAARSDDPQVGPTLVDDPLPVPADPGPADGVILVRGDAGDRAARRQTGGDFLAHDVRAAAGAAVLGHVLELVAGGAPHRVAVLAVECGQPALRGTIRARQPDVVAGGAAVAPTIPQPRPADERDGVAGRREVSLLRLEEVELPLRAALGRHD